MGTELYRRGQFLNKAFEGVNLSDPTLVERVHRDYVDAGAEVLETNTFASNRTKLARVGLEDQFEAINRAAVRIARHVAGDDRWVVGAIGPSGVAWSGLDASQKAALVAAALDQVSVLLDAGADGIVFETFAWAGELIACVEAAHARFPEVALVANAMFSTSAGTLDGVSPPEVVDAVREAGATMAGANCADGPLELYHIAETMIGRDIPIAIMPNAGYPKRVDDRMIYMATPEYFGVFARRYLKLGVDAIGGCCGTGPEHIRAMAGAVRMDVSADSDIASSTRVVVREAEASRRDAVPFAERSPLARRIADPDAFVVSVEVNPPTGLDPTRALRAVELLRDAGVDVINIADGPRASVRMANWSFGLEMRRLAGMDCILHVCMRDRNLLGLQSDLLAYHAMGFRNLVVITGDPPKMGDYPHATAVFDLDSVAALRMLRDFNEGINPAGRELGGQTSFALACGAEPAALDYDRELRRLEQKVANGADFIMTQPVYDPAVLDRFLDNTSHLGVPVLVGLLPLASAANAEFLHNEVPGMQIPGAIRERMARAGKGPEARAEGVRIAQEALLGVRERVRGAYIMPPFGRVEAAIEILSVVGFAIPDAWKATWRS